MGGLDFWEGESKQGGEGEGGGGGKVVWDEMLLGGLKLKLNSCPPWRKVLGFTEGAEKTKLRTKKEKRKIATLPNN